MEHKRILIKYTTEQEKEDMIKRLNKGFTIKKQGKPKQGEKQFSMWLNVL